MSLIVFTIFLAELKLNVDLNLQSYVDFTDILTICGGTKVSNKLSLLWTEGPKHSLGWYFHFVKITILEIKQDESPPRWVGQSSSSRRTAYKLPFILQFEPIVSNFRLLTY